MQAGSRSCCTVEGRNLQARCGRRRSRSHKNSFVLCCFFVLLVCVCVCVKVCNGEEKGVAGGGEKDQ